MLQGTGQWHGSNGSSKRKILRAIPRQITSMLQAELLWSRGITGAGVKVAIFDTGLSRNHPHFRKIVERSNWTNEKSLDDSKIPILMIIIHSYFSYFLMLASNYFQLLVMELSLPEL